MFESGVDCSSIRVYTATTGVFWRQRTTRSTFMKNLCLQNAPDVTGAVLALLQLAVCVFRLLTRKIGHWNICFSNLCFPLWVKHFRFPSFRPSQVRQRLFHLFKMIAGPVTGMLRNCTCFLWARNRVDTVSLVSLIQWLDPLGLKIFRVCKVWGWNRASPGWSHMVIDKGALVNIWLKD